MNRHRADCHQPAGLSRSLKRQAQLQYESHESHESHQNLQPRPPAAQPNPNRRPTPTAPPVDQIGESAAKRRAEQSSPAQPAQPGPAQGQRLQSRAKQSRAVQCSAAQSRACFQFCPYFVPQLASHLLLLLLLLLLLALHCPTPLPLRPCPDLPAPKAKPVRGVSGFLLQR